MIYAFDLDGTLVTLVEDSRYNECKPLAGRIAVVNKLYDEGHEIIIYTARGVVSGLTDELRKLTRHQLSDFGIKYSKLEMGTKLYYDILIDDKSANAHIWFAEQRPFNGIIAGSFDVLHPGYIHMLKEARSQCNHLLIALQEDASRDRPDAKLKPILSVKDRIEMLQSLRCVDQVISYKTEEDFHMILSHYKGHTRFLGDDYIGKDYTGSDLKGNEIVYIDRSHGWSTTKFKTKIAESIKIID